jgi:O-acetyl-ADP-ribose deacetylase (regulator of RNase III)
MNQIINAIPPHLVFKGTINKINLLIYYGNMFNVDAEIIVNPANDLMDNSGGLAKKISDLAGKGLDDECRSWVKRNGRIPQGEVALTQAHNLSNRYKGIIHAVGPTGKDNKTPSEDEENQLIGTILESLIQANTGNCSSIALPSISTGIFNYNKEYAAKNHLEAFIIFAGQYKVYKPEGTLKDVKIVIFEQEVLLKFIEKIVEKMDIFDIFEYIGTPLEIANGLIFSYCNRCERTFTLDWFYFSSTNCSPHCCDFCVFDEKMRNCVICRKTFSGQKNTARIDYNYFCRRCQNMRTINEICSCPIETPDT